MHTHATESYEGYDSEYYDTRNTWRSTDNNENMVAVGNVIEEELRKAGIGVVHDTRRVQTIPPTTAPMTGRQWQ